MTKPLIANRKRQSEADVFHKRCFKRWGNQCYRPGCKSKATDAAHLVARAHLGKTQRYAFPEDNARPLCRPCHLAQEAGEWNFSLRDRRSAVAKLNKISKQPLSEPV